LLEKEKKKKRIPCKYAMIYIICTDSKTKKKEKRIRGKAKRRRDI